jgi:hypothetical protein
VSQHNPFNFSPKQLFNYNRGRSIRQVTMTRLDPLFYRPRAMRIVLQKFLVVIGLDDERVHFAQSFRQHFRGVTKIGDKSERAGAGMKSEPDGIDRVMRNGKGLHNDVADAELSAGMKDSPVSMFVQAAVLADGFSGQGIAIDWQREFAAKYLQSTNMVSVFVGEENAIQFVRCYAALLEAQDELARAQSAIN